MPAGIRRRASNAVGHPPADRVGNDGTRGAGDRQPAGRDLPLSDALGGAAKVERRPGQVSLAAASASFTAEETGPSLAQPGSCQSSQASRARPMISSLSRSDSQGNSSVKNVTHSRYDGRIREMSVPQNIRAGPNVS